MLSRKVPLAFSAALALLLVVGVVSYRNNGNQVVAEEWVAHTQEVLATLAGVLSDVNEAESLRRAYFTTSDSVFLRKYETSAAAAYANLARVRQLTVDNAPQQRRLDALDPLITRRLRQLAQLIDLQGKNPSDVAVQVSQTLEGEEMQAGVRDLLAEMVGAERILLQSRIAKARASTRLAIFTILLGTVLAVGFLGVGLSLLLREITQRARAEEALRGSEVTFRGILESATDAMVIADAQGRIVFVNAETEHLFGYRRDEMVGQPIEILVPARFQGGHSQHRQGYAAHPRKRPMGERSELRGLRKDATEFPIEVSLSPLETQEGLYIASAVRDITGRKIIEEALFAEKERAQVTLNCIGDAVVCTDTLGNITFLNFVAEKMTGWPWQQAVGRPMAEVFRILDAASRETIANPMEMAVGQDRTVHMPSNCILIRRDGFEIPIEDSVAPIHDREGQTTGAVIVFRDVSAARTMALQMTHLAQHDFLTGLPNRMLLEDRVSQAIALAPRHKKKIAVLFLDLDGFKHINDSLGHPVGDKLLQSIAKRLVDCVRGSDTISRQGGDEFVVLLSEVAHSEDAAIKARRMLQAVEGPHPIDTHDLHVTASIGVSVYPDDGLDAETLIKNADTAMYQAKENGPQSYRFFKPAMNVRAVERQSIEESLRRALERQEFALHYQPKINLRTGEITGAEALIRWTHPTRGPVPPAQFIPIAEDCGLIVPIGNWVLREACKQARAWMDAGLPLTTMAVNISAKEFRDKNFLKSVFATLNDTGIDPRSLELELTESVLMMRTEFTESILMAMKARGVKLAVDDFGTGYSSLSYLRKFPIDALKIDQSFVRQITTAPDETTIVTAMIRMGRNLKLGVVAEGVETQEEMAFLQAHQCTEAQGYYFSRPVLPEQFAKLLETGISETVLH
jgi:diguanylate cyclase (GGDEF)-like protein/PAS domain S-box-containing protein